jgi:hypothetical protein
MAEQKPYWVDFVVEGQGRQTDQAIRTFAAEPIGRAFPALNNDPDTKAALPFLPETRRMVDALVVIPVYLKHIVQTTQQLTVMLSFLESDTLSPDLKELCGQADSAINHMNAFAEQLRNIVEIPKSYDPARGTIPIRQRILKKDVPLVEWLREERQALDAVTVLCDKLEKATGGGSIGDLDTRN